MKRRIYVGFDARDRVAFEVAKASIRSEHLTQDVEIVPLYDWELRYRKLYWRSYFVDERGQRWDNKDGKPFSTDFSFTRFCVPMLEEFGDEVVMFVDPDVMFRADIHELFDLWDDKFGVMCVKHKHRPAEAEKMAGLLQTSYKRKNWSSLMLIKPSRCQTLTPYLVNNATGSQLHAMTWIANELIGSLPVAWNWLEGASDPNIDPKMVHFTRGTPDLPGYENVPFADEWRGIRDALQL